MNNIKLTTLTKILSIKANISTLDNHLWDLQKHESLPESISEDKDTRTMHQEISIGINFLKAYNTNNVILNDQYDQELCALAVPLLEADLQSTIEHYYEDLEDNEGLIDTNFDPNMDDHK